jgi:hypothetical protein
MMGIEAVFGVSIGRRSLKIMNYGISVLSKFRKTSGLVG